LQRTLARPHAGEMRHALLSARPSPTNTRLVQALHEASWEELEPRAALQTLRTGDVTLGRLDVLPTLDGVEDGLWALGALAARGVIVLNDPAALLAAHDKLLTARLLRRHGIPHPATLHVRPGRDLPPFAVPAVVKPRFGSWGSEVHLCEDTTALAAALEYVRQHEWFQRTGVLIQALVAPRGYDLRIVVAGGRVVGAVERVAAPGEWRTNVALGAERRPVEAVPEGAAALALAAASAAGASLVGVDLLPTAAGGWTVIELNGAVEFTAEYARNHDVFAEAALALQREGLRRAGLVYAA